MKTTAKKIINGITTVVVVLVVILAVLLVGVRLFGLTPYTILSPSMAPAYQPGDLVYVKSKPAAEIEKGEVLTFVADDQLTVVTHRVDEADRENNCFYTKGDANKDRDGNPVLYQNVLGVVVFSIPKLGYVSTYLTDPANRFMLIAIGAALLLLFLLPDIGRLWKKEKPAPAESDPDIS